MNKIYDGRGLSFVPVCENENQFESLHLLHDSERNYSHNWTLQES